MVPFFINIKFIRKVRVCNFLIEVFLNKAPILTKLFVSNFDDMYAIKILLRLEHLNIANLLNY
jgi:hypothetical protein